MRRLLAATIATLGLGLAAGRAEAGPAHGETRLAVDPKQVNGPAIEVSADLVLPASRTSTGWGSIRTVVRNQTAEARDVSIEIGESQGSQRRAFRLAPGETATADFAARDGDGSLNVQCASPSIGRSNIYLYSGRSGWDSILILDVSATGAPHQAWIDGLDSLWKARTSPTRGKPVPIPVELDALPERWPLLSAADAILVDADAASLSVERQRAIARYVAAGGTLVLSHAPVLGAGPLLELQEVSFDVRGADGTTSGRYGFGRWVAARESAAGGMVASDVLGTILDRRLAGPPVVGETGVLPFNASRRLEIPGLGEVSVRAFFAWIALFATLVGVAVLVLQRRFGRRTALVVVVPALGLLFTAGILAYGLLSEGLSTRGVVRTFSFLDQRSHDAVSIASRTVYAGISPDALRLSPDTLLSQPNVAGGGYRSYRRYGGDAARALDVDWTGGGGVVDGSVIASRTPTGLATSTAGRARERLRFRRTAGGFDVVADASFAPVPGPAGVLFRHGDGQYYLGGAGGSLAPIEEAGVRGAIDAILGRYRAVEPETRSARGPYDGYEEEYGGYAIRVVRSPIPAATTVSAVAAVDRLGAAIGSTLPPGSYLALTSSAPGFETLGLKVAYERETHVVFGLLAGEDVDE